MDGRGWLVTVHGVTKIRRIRLSDFSFSFRASLVAQTVKKERKKESEVAQSCAKTQL